MSLHAVERLLYELNRDPAKVAEFREHPAELLERYALTDEERGWLRERDVLALYRHGVHPLLLAAASRFFGIEQSVFRATLAPALGERVR